MVKITKAEEQAIRLVMSLGTSGRQMTLAELARSERLPEPTVAKLLGMLRRGGVVEAVRGRNGGYVLNGATTDISTAAIIRAVGSEIVQTNSCLDGTDGDDCPRLDDCGLRSVWRHLEKRVGDLLENTSVADLLDVEESVTRHVRQVWPAQLKPRELSETAGAGERNV